MLQTVANWLSRYESVAIWLEGIALVLIFIWDRIDANEQQKEMLKQLDVMRKQAETMQLQAAAAQDNAVAGGTGLTSGWQSLISSARLFHSELQAHIVLPLQAYRCLYPLEL